MQILGSTLDLQNQTLGVGPTVYINRKSECISIIRNHQSSLQSSLRGYPM